MGVEAHKVPPQGKVLAPSKLAHVVLRTKNFSSMVSFYKIFLGAHATYENKQLAFLTYDDEHHRVAIAAVPNTTVRDLSSTGMDHIAFTFNSLRDLTLAYKQRAAYEFNENPIGVEVDPEDIIKRLDNGEGEKSIKKRPHIGPRGSDSIVMSSELAWVGPE
ncbi:glyoxalase/Bleomycin resistance protein/Dioxygenase [Seiridium cupressi]